MNEPIIKIMNLNKSFGAADAKTQVLFNISLSVNPGELTLLVGPTGCGKTTLISIIGGILAPDNGEVEVFNHRIDLMSDLQKTEFRKKNIGFVFQQFNLINTLTVKENIILPLLANNVVYKEALNRVDKILKVVELENKGDSKPSKLSVGQQQKVAIARAIVNNGRLLICDEPTASLDGKTGQKVVEMLKFVALQADKSVIIVTHDNRIFQYADRIIEMEDGKIISQNSGDQENNI